MPSSFVLPVYCTPVASFAIRISAPAIAPPVGSSTRPLMVPFGDCPDTQPAETSAANPQKTILRSHIRLLLRRTSCVVFLRSTEERTDLYHDAIIGERNDSIKEASN